MYILPLFAAGLFVCFGGRGSGQPTDYPNLLKHLGLGCDRMFGLLLVWFSRNTAGSSTHTRYACPAWAHAERFKARTPTQSWLARRRRARAAAQLPACAHRARPSATASTCTEHHSLVVANPRHGARTQTRSWRARRLHARAAARPAARARGKRLHGAADGCGAQGANPLPWRTASVAHRTRLRGPRSG